MNLKQVIEHAKKTDPLFGASDYDSRALFVKKGYHSVVLGFDAHRMWPEVHDWCKQNIGEQHYVCTGSRFWFEREQDAVWFALRWS
jgi:hypothetical protein